MELVWQKQYYTPVLLSLRTRKVVYCRHYKFVVARIYFCNALKERTSMKVLSLARSRGNQGAKKKIISLKCQKS